MARSVLLTGLSLTLVMGANMAANAQDAKAEPTRQEIALAAGYKAMFTCSGMFNGDKSSEQIMADELSNYYGDYVAPMALTGEAKVNEVEKYVSVSFADDMPPRISAWREHLGCTALPEGAEPDFIKNLPRVKLRAPKYDPAEVMWPKGDKLPNDPLAEDIDEEALDTVIDKAFSGGFKGGTTAVVITQNGRLVSERYRDDFDKFTSQRTWSVAKSVGASIIGAAQYKGMIDVKDKAGLKAWSRKGDPRGAITVENLLQMASGLNSDPAGNRTDAVYFGGGLVVQNATKNPLEAPPGARWRYANNDTMLAMRALREKMSNDRRYHTFAFTNLLHKIGMFHTVPEMDWDGDFILSSQVWTTGRDLARLGQLYLNDGVWDGQRILPEGWADYVAAPAKAQPPNRLGENAEKPGRGYGAQFWRYENYPGVPNDTYAALGNRGQFVIIVPSRQAVIVRRGYDWRGNYFDGPAFAAEVLAALEE
ncbi:beta-lactamase family protein [Hellea sp.]|nr:beta-lactamase family protein [Hellea sp.]